MSLRVIGSRGVTLPADSLTLAAHATETLDLNELLAGLPADEADAGGIRVEYNGQRGELIVSGGLEEVEKGYSATLPFYPHDPDGSSPSTVSYASTGIMAGRPDPAMGFPKDTRFTPYAYVRNTTSAAMEVGPTVYFMSGKNPASLALPNLQLAPYQASEVPLAAALARQGLADYSGMITLTLAFRGHPVDLLEAAGSVDQTGTYVFEVTPHVVAPGGAKHAPFWDVAGGNDTMITLWNPAGMPEDIVATFLFAGGSGHYRLPLHLAGYASQSIDVGQLIAAEQPDAQGNLIPPSAEQGSVEFSGPGGLSDQISLAIEGGTFNVRTATCGGGTYCIICVGLASCAVNPNPTNVSVGSSSQATATGTYSNGSTENDTSKSSWSSSATSIATVETKGDANPGLVSGVSPGTATVTVDDPSFESGKACGLFPACTVVIVACSLPVGVEVLGSFAISVTSTPVPGETNSVVSGQSAQVQVVAKDQFGSTFTDYRGTVHFSSTDTLATLPADYTYTASDAGVHSFSVTLKTVAGTSATRDLTVSDQGAGVSNQQNVNVWFQVTMDVERWENCGDRTCVNDGSYCYTTACDPSSGSAFASPTPFVSLPGSKSSICNLGVLVVYAPPGASPSSASTTVQDCGPQSGGGCTSAPYWNTGSVPALGTAAACLSDQLATNLGISNGCNGTTAFGQASVFWRFQ